MTTRVAYQPRSKQAVRRLACCRCGCGLTRCGTTSFADPGSPSFTTVAGDPRHTRRILLSTVAANTIHTAAQRYQRRHVRLTAGTPLKGLAVVHMRSRHIRCRQRESFIRIRSHDNFHHVDGLVHDPSSRLAARREHARRSAISQRLIGRTTPRRPPRWHTHSSTWA